MRNKRFLLTLIATLFSVGRANFALGSTDASPSCEEKYLCTKSSREEIGQRAFWAGLAGMVAGALFDRADMRQARSVSYGLWGLGWAAWIGSSGERWFTDREDYHDSGLESDPFRGASVQGAIGESSNLHLIPQGFYIHPLFNDANGGTDKLLTGSLKLGYIHSFDEFSIESIAYWRLLTPSFKAQFNDDDLPKPVGRYADWMELKTGVSRQTQVGDINWRNQVTVGLNDIGDKGGKDMHRNIHRLTRNTLDHLDYTDQPDGRFMTLGIESGFSGLTRIDRLPLALHHLISLQGETSKMMQEVGVQWNMNTIIVPKWWEQATEVRVIKQIHSDVYTGIKSWRYEAAIGVRLLKVLTPTVKYISSYLQGDDVGQTYFDLIHYNFEF